VSFVLTALGVQPKERRLRLEFIAFEEIEYQVHFRSGPGSEWSGPVPFALEPGAPETHTSLLGQANIATVYLDASQEQGIYAVAMRAGPV
jgi:hypothetical protein